MQSPKLEESFQEVLKRTSGYKESVYHCSCATDILRLTRKDIRITENAQNCSKATMKRRKITCLANNQESAKERSHSLYVLLQRQLKKKW